MHLLPAQLQRSLQLSFVNSLQQHQSSHMLLDVSAALSALSIPHSAPYLMQVGAFLADTQPSINFHVLHRCKSDPWQHIRMLACMSLWCCPCMTSYPSDTDMPVKALQHVGLRKLIAMYIQNTGDTMISKR